MFEKNGKINPKKINKNKKKKKHSKFQFKKNLGNSQQILLNVCDILFLCTCRMVFKFGQNVNIFLYLTFYLWAMIMCIKCRFGSQI
jgi:hypothetical protein